MSRATELAAALRLCTRYNDSGCRDCQFNVSRRCVSTLKLTAANELEELTDRRARYAEEIAVLQEERKRASSADAAPVLHGQWDGEGDGYADGELVVDVWYCSRCGHCIDDGTDDPVTLPNYCPNCGAKMDGGGEHEVC